MFSGSGSQAGDGHREPPFISRGGWGERKTIDNYKLSVQMKPGLHAENGSERERKGKMMWKSSPQLPPLCRPYLYFISSSFKKNLNLAN